MKNKYQYLVNVLKDRIETMGKNEKIPSERQLAEQFNMSRLTVRKAVDQLVSQNKLYRINKVGTFTTDEKLYKKTDTFKGFSREVKKAGGTPSNKLIEYSLKGASKDIAFKLGIKEGDPVYKVVRLRLKNNVPIMIDQAYFPQAVIPLSETIVKGSIYDYITKTLGLKIKSAEQTYHATFAKEAFLKDLEIEKSTPVIKTELQVYLEDGRIFEYNVAYINTNHYQIVSKSFQ